MNDIATPDQPYTSEVPVNLPANRQDPEFYSDAIVELLNRLEVDYVFLLPGASYRGLHDSLVNFGRNHKPTIVLATHEQIAVSMAHGYAKATGRLGVCILHNLVGVMNGSMAVYNAYGDHVPVLVLGGSGPLDPNDRRWIDWLHSANTQSDIVKPYVKWAEEPPTGQAILDAIGRGHKIALTPPRGPVYVTIDCGVQEARIAGGLRIPEIKYFQPPPPVAANPEALETAAEYLIAAEFPLIVGGRLGFNPAATAPLVDLVDLVGAAYRDDLGLVTFPTNHPQNLGGDRALLSQADAILAIDCRDVASLIAGYTTHRTDAVTDQVRAERGASRRKVIDMSLNDMSPSSWSYLKGPLAPIDLQLACDPLLGMRQLADVLRRRLSADEAGRARIARRKAMLADRHKQLRARQREAARKGWDDTPIAPGRMVSELWDAVKGKNWLLPVRNRSGFPEGVWEFTGVGQHLGHNGGGGVGYGPGAAVGAAIANRDSGRLCVSLFGDGDFLMSASAIWTAVHYRVPMLAVINNNNTWGNDEKHQLEVAADRGRPRENAWIGQRMAGPAIDYATTARSYGAWGAGPITDPGELATVFRQAVAEVEKGGVAVVDVRTKLV
jgi:thiamine pyrophosphate-dependent acetolactate synthase large subunit-like protein